MPTLSAVAARIADELARDDLSAQITNAVQDAIKHYERRRFQWNEGLDTFSTVVGQEFYGAADASWIPYVVTFDSVRILQSGSRFVLCKRTYPEIDDWQTGTVTGTPTDYAYYAAQIRLYPIPNLVQPITVSYVKRLPTLEAGDTNAWTEDGEQLIRMRAKIILFEEVIRDPAEAEVLRRREAEVLAAIRTENSARTSAGIVAHYL